MSDQAILFTLLGVVFALLVWGRIRYDLVAFGALILAAGYSRRFGSDKRRFTVDAQDLPTLPVS